LSSEQKYSDQLFDLLKELSNANLKFVVCGGVACVLHGVERATYDIDISVDMKKNNLEKLITVAKKFNLIPRIPEPVENLLDDKKRQEWKEKKGALVYTFVSGTGPLQMDIFLDYPKSYSELLKKAEIIKIDNIDILISSKEDLIFAKESIIPLRDKDMLDIKELKNLR
jgi:hypothetical protein